MTQGALVVLLGHDGRRGERRHFCPIFVPRELTFLEVRGIKPPRPLALSLGRQLPEVHDLALDAIK